MLELLGMLSGASDYNNTYHEDKFLDPKFAKQKEMIQEISSAFGTFGDKEIASVREIATDLAECFNKCFANIQSANKKGGNSPDIEAAINAVDTTSLFQSVQQAKAMDLFTKMKTLIPANTPPEIAETYRNIFDGLVNAKTPEDFKKFMVETLKNPKNAEAVEAMKETLDAALKTPGIEKLVAVATNPKIIKAVSEVANSRAGKNLARVLANKKSTAFEIGAAKTRLMATALPKLGYYASEIAGAINIGMKMEAIQIEANKEKMQEREMQSSMNTAFSKLGESGGITSEEEGSTKADIDNMRKMVAEDPSVSFHMKGRVGNVEL
jgi:hypothetical protein